MLGSYHDIVKSNSLYSIRYVLCFRECVFYSVCADDMEYGRHMTEITSNNNNPEIEYLLRITSFP